MSNSIEVTCHRCNRPAFLVGQYKARAAANSAQSVQTLDFHCTGCNGRIYLQPAGRGSGGVRWHPVQLPRRDIAVNPIKPQEQMQLQAAYTLSESTTPASHHRSVPPLPAPQVAYRLEVQAPGAMISELDPLHPANLRRRLNPHRLQDMH